MDLDRKRVELLGSVVTHLPALACRNNRSPGSCDCRPSVGKCLFVPSLRLPFWSGYGVVTPHQFPVQIHLWPLARIGFRGASTSQLKLRSPASAALHAPLTVARSIATSSSVVRAIGFARAGTPASHLSLSPALAWADGDRGFRRRSRVVLEVRPFAGSLFAMLLPPSRPDPYSSSCF